jgi:hypothetical protein
VRLFAGEPLTVDALRADAYVESLLASAERRAPAVPVDLDLDPDVASTARVLQSSLLRVHPSFRFEDRLSRRLAEAARAMRREGSSAGVPNDRSLAPGDAAGSILIFPAIVEAADGSFGDRFAAARPVVAWASAGAVAASVVARLPLSAPAVRPDTGPTIAGAALTSAALSLGAAAIVAWRRGRLRRGIA